MERLSQKMEYMELRVLLIEDSEPDSELAIRRLGAAGFKCTYRRVINEQEMRSALKEGLPDLILSDFSLPGFGGMTALAVALAKPEHTVAVPIEQAAMAPCSSVTRRRSGFTRKKYTDVSSAAKSRMRDARIDGGLKRAHCIP